MPSLRYLNSILTVLLGKMIGRLKFVRRKVVTTLSATAIQYKNRRLRHLIGFDDLKILPHTDTNRRALEVMIPLAAYCLPLKGRDP